MKTLAQLNAEEMYVQQAMNEYEAYERTLAKLTKYTSIPETITLTTLLESERFEYNNGYFIQSTHTPNHHQNLLIGKNGKLLPDHPLNHPECDLASNTFTHLMNKVRELKA